jgi:predicted dehydrogenase
MGRVRICVIGAGRAGMIHARNVAWRIKDGELAAVCDPNPATLEAARQELGEARFFADYREALADDSVDAAIIVTPTFLHRNVAVAAAEQGKHIFLEKPMAVTIAECDAINAAVATAGVRLQLGFMRRFDEGFMRAREILAGGDMGRVMIIKSTGRGPGGPGPWMWDLKKSNGIVAEVNSHDIDAVLWMTQDRIVRLYAEAHNFKMPEVKEKFPDFYDNVVVSLRLSDGAMGMIDGTCPAHYGYDARMEILCEKGLLMVGTVQQQGCIKVTVEGRVEGQAVKTWRTLFKDAYLAEMEHFVQCVQSGAAPRVNGTDGRNAVEAVLAINQSVKLGQVVKFPEGGAN